MDSDEQIHHDFIAISPGTYGGGYYGKGNTVEEAKQAMRRQGGSLSRYVVFRLPEHSVNAYVDDFGVIHWMWPEGYDGPLHVDLEEVAKRGLKQEG